MNTATAITIAALAALTPTVTCLIGIVLARQDVRDLRGEVARGLADVRTELRSEMAGLRADLRGEMAGLRGDMAQMRNDVHADLLMIHERVANVEGRQGR